VSIAGRGDIKRLYGFGLIPLVPNNSVDSILQVIKQISTLPHLKGVIMGTKAVGKGLDDPEMEPVWQALSEAGLVVFLHPHYGLGSGAKELYGERDNGHVLSLAIGFPTETTVVCPRPPWYPFLILFISFPRPSHGSFLQVFMIVTPA
jgi:predicted TIM-barrel fold metal-dependent hydrolase